MRSFIKLKINKPIIFSVLVAIITIGGMNLLALVVGLVVGIEKLQRLDSYTLLLINEIIGAGLVLGLAYASSTLYTLRRKGSGLLRGFGVGAFPATMICLVAFSMFVTSYMMGEVVKPVHNIVIYFLGMFMIGFVEELAFRGMVAESLIRFFGTSTKGVWKATAISGVIFGVAHMSNALEAELLGVFVQSSVAIVLGMLLAAIYYRTGNIWVCILLHGGLDAASLLASGVFGDGTVLDAVSSYSLINLLPCITYFIPVLVLLRKSKNYQVQQWFGKANVDN